MRKILYILIAFSTFITGIFWYRNYDQEFYKFCKSPEQDLNFKKLNIEKQFQTYIKYDCRYDSEPARIYWGFHIGEKEEAIEFLLDKLKNENNEDVLKHTLEMMLATVRQQEINGREDIVGLVNQTIEKIQKKDQKSFPDKLFESNFTERKERLLEIATEINERSKMTKSEYWVKSENERKEKIKKEMEKLVKEIIEKAEQKKAEQNKANQKYFAE